MSNAYTNCYNLTGSPICGNNVSTMMNAYNNCFNLTGTPACGENVASMNHAYYNCQNLTGSPACGNKVWSMFYTYYNCFNLTGAPACGNSVTHMNYAYANCKNLSGNAYFYSESVWYATGCFFNRSNNYALNLYVKSNSRTFNTCTITTTSSIVKSTITWTNDMATNGCYYNTAYNIYIYPVANVAAAREANGD